MTKRRSIMAGVVVAVIATVMWLRREPAWSVTLAGDRAAELTPWQAIHVAATVEPSDAMEGRWLKGGDWKFTWDTDGTPNAISGADGQWRSGKVGDRVITVTVESPWGTKKTASIHKTIRYGNFVLPSSPALQTPDLAALPTDPSPDNLPFGIADVWVEKTKVCQGEPTRIRLTPYDKRGKDKWLVPVVAGEQAWETTFIVPITHPGPRMVQVTLQDAGGALKGGVVDSIDTYVYVEVMDCVAPFPMFLEHRPIPPDDNNVAFRVRLFDGPKWVTKLADNTGQATSPIAKAASFHWTFGDGTTVTTTEPMLTHRFPDEVDRPDERATLYKVQVDAVDATSKTMATSYTSIELPNHFRDLKQEQGLVQLVTKQAPGSQESSDGSRYAEITLTNLDSVETAQLTDMKIHFTSCDGDGLTETTADPHSVFSTLTVPPRGKISGKFSLAAQGANVCYANSEVSGTSAPGKLKVLGFFQLVTTDQPPGIPVSEEQEKVMAQAMQLLGNPKIVTNEDLRRLEDEGKIPRYVLTKDPFGPDN